MIVLQNTSKGAGIATDWEQALLDDGDEEGEGLFTFSFSRLTCVTPLHLLMDPARPCSNANSSRILFLLSKFRVSV